jgi:hypothetical protein
MGIDSMRGGPARQILVDFRIAGNRALKRATRVVDEECERMRRQMLVLARDRRALRQKLPRIFPGGTRNLRWKRKRLLREMEAVDGDG